MHARWCVRASRQIAETEYEGECYAVEKIRYIVYVDRYCEIDL